MGSFLPPVKRWWVRPVTFVPRGTGTIAIRGDVGEAEQQFKAALAVNPDNLLYALLNLGVIYSRTGREELARAMYRKVIENDASKSNYPTRIGEDNMKGKTLKKIAESNLVRLN